MAWCRIAGGLAALMLGVGPLAAQGAGAPPALHGIALGMGAAAAMRAARLPCRQTPAGNLLCRDAADRSTYKATLSGGGKPVVLTVSHRFCTTGAPEAVRARARAALGAAPAIMHDDPDGRFFDLDHGAEGVLDTDLGPCGKGRPGRRVELSIRSDMLLREGLPLKLR